MGHVPGEGTKEKLVRPSLGGRSAQGWQAVKVRILLSSS